MIPALAHWWVRILVMIGACAASGLVVGFGTDVAPEAAQSLVYGVAVVTMVAIATYRPGGVAVSSGIVPTPATLRFALMGTVWAVLSLAAVATAGLTLGGRFVPVTNVVPMLHGVTGIILFAIGEEVVFRGTIFEALEERFGPILAIVVTSVPFALVHAANPGASLLSIVNVALAGIALGTCVAITHTLWTAIMFHVVWNVGTALFFGLVSGLDLGVGITELSTTGIAESRVTTVIGPFGIEDGLVTTLLLLAATAILVRWRRFDPYVRAARFRGQFAHPRGTK